jgi:hypothetical protein
MIRVAENYRLRMPACILLGYNVHFFHAFARRVYYIYIKLLQSFKQALSNAVRPYYNGRAAFNFFKLFKLIPDYFNALPF